MLSDQHLADPFLPLAWQGVLEDLQAFMTLQARLKQSAAPEEAESLLALHDRLVEKSAALLEPAALADLSEDELHRMLWRAVLALVQLKQAVIGDQPVLDTAGSRTLALFESDFFGAAQDVQDFLDTVRDILRLSQEDCDTERRKLDADLSDARRKQAIVRALRDEFHLWAGDAELRQGIVGLFQAIHGDSPIAPDEIEVVVTSTLIFFCLPLAKDGETLTSPRFARLSPPEQADVRVFLQSLKKFTQERFATFPAFGLVDCTRLCPELVARLAERAGVTPDEVLREVPRLITVLPQAEIDKYLIHDIWGHGWQASMLRYDDLYERMARFADPLDLKTCTRMRSGEELGLTSCFILSGTVVQLDEARFCDFVTAEVFQRLPIALTAVLAETLADVAEFKFLAENPTLASWLPSSSRLAKYPSMLDLTLEDVPFYFCQATKAFRLFAKQERRQQRLVEQLVADGANRTSAAQAVARAAELWRDWERADFTAELAWQVRDGRLQVNAFTRVALNFLGLHRALIQTYAQASSTAPGRLPLKSFRDLLVLAASVFFEANPAANLWRLDEFLTLVVVPFCQRLAQARPTKKPRSTEDLGS